MNSFLKLANARLTNSFEDLTFDIRHGIDTFDCVDIEHLFVNSPSIKYAKRYQPASIHTLKKLFRQIAPLQESYRFIDLGCGKGRALIMAARFGFERSIGVEFSPQLANICQNNLRRCRIEAQIECIDAKDFLIPDGSNIIYMFNPFGEEILKEVACNIRLASKEAHNSNYIVYVTPVHLDILKSSGFVGIATLNRGTRQQIEILRARREDV